MSTRRALRAIPAVAAIVTALATVNPVPASADPWLNTPGPDNREVTYCFGGAFRDRPALRAAAHYAMQNLQGQTTFTRNFVGDCTSLTDIVFRVTGDPALRGAYRCVAVNPSGRCQQANIWMNPNNLANEINRRKTACHEVGHYGRLVHHNPPYNDCMVSGHISSGHQHYNGHHVWHLNQPL
jgi:hypothetical protein